MQETWVWSLGREDPTWGGATEAREPQLRSSGARELQLLKPQGELRRRSRWPGKPTHHSEGGPSSPQLETARAQHEDGAQPSINKQIKSHAKTVCRVIANLIWLMSLWEEIGTHQGTCKHGRKATEGTMHEKAAIWKPETGLKRNQPEAPVYLPSSLQTHEKVGFCCLSHPACSILFRQPQQTKKMGIRLSSWIPLSPSCVSDITLMEVRADAQAKLRLLLGQPRHTRCAPVC